VVTKRKNKLRSGSKEKEISLEVVPKK